MKAYSDNKETYGYYSYDDAGQRMYKVTLNNTLSRINALGDNVLEVEKLMLYPNGYININQDGNYTKHYYAEDARIASKIGSGYEASITAGTDSLKMVEALEVMQKELGEVTNDTIENISCNFTQITHLQGDSCKFEEGLYFYHGNHLNSTQFITDINANVKQAVLYTPWGSIISEYHQDWMLDTIPRYLFNAKELDEENGMYYYSARYYAPPTFISRDPMFEKYPSISPYTYCMNNPVCVIDPDGRDGIGVVNIKNKTITISATYFVQSIPYPNQSTTAYTKEEIANMQAETNKTLNEAGYTVSSGRYEGYSVVFNLQFKEGGDAPNTEDKASREFFENYSVGNSFQKGNLKTHPNIFSPKSNGDVTGGVTQDNKKILMNEKYDTERNQIHEIFHTLFFNQDNAPNGIGSYTNPDLPNQNDIDILINNPNLIKIIESEE